MRKLLLSSSFLFACLMTFAQAWDGSSTKAFSGEGTADKPYLIDEPAQLAYLAVRVNGGDTYEGKYFKQTKDLDLGSKQWTMIGNDGKSLFKGIYDGDNKAINNLMVSGSASAGLFGYVENATLRQVRIENGHVQATTAAAALLYRATSSSIVDCSNNANVTVDGSKGLVTNVVWAAGLVWAAKDTKIVRCFNAGTITAITLPLSSAYAVGITYKGDVIEDCYNTGSIVTKGTDKSIAVGICLNLSKSVTNCYNASTLKAASSFNITKTEAQLISCYYDKELNEAPGEIGVTGLTTAEMKSGKVWDGFDTRIWKFVEGAYPTLIESSSPTGNESVAAPKAEDNFSVSVYGRQVIVSGQIAGKLLSVVNVQGIPVTKEIAMGNEVGFTVPFSGIYVISVGGMKTLKVKIK